MDEDWELLVTFLPTNWRELAISSGALKGLRKDKDPANLLRVLLMHLGCGHSLRETVVRAHEAQLANLSDVALLKRLRKAKDWLHALCVEFYQEQGVAVSNAAGLQMRAFDATTVKEPGKTGALWRIHYSITLPSLVCDHFKVTGTKGVGTGESLRQFPIGRGDYILVDRGYSTPQGIHHVVACGGLVTVRVNQSVLRFTSDHDQPFDLLTALSQIDQPGHVGEWDVAISAEGVPPIAGRICVLRKSEAAIQQAHKHIRRKAQKKGRVTRPETFEYAKYVTLFSTFPASAFSADDVLQWYRLRWQVELAFKRMKSLASLGHLPKYDADSAEAWLYGKLLIALLIEKFIYQANTISPWGYDGPFGATT